MADHNDAGSRGEEDAPRDPADRGGDTVETPVPGGTSDRPGSAGAQAAPDAGARAAGTGTGTFGQPSATGAYGPYGPGGRGWSAPGWATTTTAAAAPPRPGRYARLTGAARGRTFQIVAAALIGALVGGGFVAVVDRFGDRHRGGYAAERMDGREWRGRSHDDGRGFRERERGGERGYRGGPGIPMPRDGSRLPGRCTPIEGGFTCTYPTPPAPQTPATPSPSS
ncbi:hypothetical protein ACFFMN_10955 [Planobispora siamensis]|uniref:Uncharacterized protein n=1 Tax=Planobispora siamensis TaxID=936338 RepID=A0A8J3WH47_9ACTN|nr:hypothetical protein [Planobispora siamensis]GIH90139.1 hypothetical protein Psi01_07690 [Planobispora siamensis]